MTESESAWKSDAPPPSRHGGRWIFGATALAIFALVGLDAYLSHRGQATLGRLMPMLNASGAVKVELDTFHLWFETLTRSAPDHDATEDEADVRRHLDNAARQVRDLRAMADAGKVVLTVQFAPELDALQDRIVSLSNVTQRRLAATPDTPAARALDAEFLTVYTRTHEHASRVQALLEGMVRANVASVRDTSVLMYVLFAAVVLLGLWLSRRRNRELRQSRELFSSAFRSNPSLIAISHPETGEHVDINEAWANTLQYSRKEAIGRTAFDMGLWANVGDRERILEEQARTGRIRDFETRLKAKDGTLVDVSISTEPIQMGERELVLWSANDITARRRSEREKEYQRTLFEAIFQGIPDAIVYAGPERRIVAVNRGFEIIFGYGPDELAGQPTSAIYASDEEFARQGRIRFHAGAVQTSAPYTVQYRRKDGALFPGETLGTKIEDADGNFLGFIGVIRDITDRQQIERQLIQAKEEAEYANYAKTQFLANMSHELRTPLNAIIGFADMMQIGAFGPLDNEKYKAYINDIRASGGHLLDIITDILDVSMIEAGQLTLQFEDVSLEDIARACLAILAPQAIERGVDLYCDFPVELPRLHADPLRLKQVCINLVSNAIKFNKPNGRIDIKARTDSAGGLVLTVSDTGIGISAADLKRAVEPFGQAGDTATRPHGGSGLGLTLSKSLIEMHGGSLEVDSVPGEGTTVRCIFPPEHTVDD